jgi:hypothetical protein
MTCAPYQTPQTLEEALALIALLCGENQLLRQKVDALVRRVFGTGKNEKLDPRQLEILLTGLQVQPAAPQAQPAPVAAPVSAPAKAAERKPARSGIPENLPIERTVLLPEEVKASPESFRQIDELVTRELDWEPAKFYWHYIIRPKFVRKEAAAQAAILPVVPAAVALVPASEKEVFVAKMPNRLIDKGLPGVGLLIYIILSRFEDHLPFYRMEKIFRQRHQMPLARQSLVDWTERVADWLKPIWQQMIVEAFSGGYLQADETPVEYLDRDIPGHTLKGYFWVYAQPGGNVIFDWNTSRGREGPIAFLKNFKGCLQTDGYGVYPSLVRERNEPLVKAGAPPELIHFTCWAHVRRKFFESKDQDRRAGWFIKQIGLLYRLEKRLRLSKAGPSLREAARQSEAKMVLNRMEGALKRIGLKVLPKSLLGIAISYTLGMWPELIAYAANGKVEIDNNGIENAIRPTAIGKKNFLFIGHPDAGWRSAVIYSILGACHRYQIGAEQYLKDILTRLPDALQNQIPSMTPCQWAKVHPEARTLPPK